MSGDKYVRRHKAEDRRHEVGFPGGVAQVDLERLMCCSSCGRAEICDFIGLLMSCSSCSSYLYVRLRREKKEPRLLAPALSESRYADPIGPDGLLLAAEACPGRAGRFRHPWLNGERSDQRAAVSGQLSVPIGDSCRRGLSRPRREISASKVRERCRRTASSSAKSATAKPWPCSRLGIPAIPVA